MKAKELKAWVNQLSDEENIYITAMNDNFFEDFECHSIYPNGEQAQELILNGYVEKYIHEDNADEEIESLEELLLIAQNEAMTAQKECEKLEEENKKLKALLNIGE